MDDMPIVKKSWYDDDNEQLYIIRFVKIDGEWWAVLQDVCNALNLKTFDVSRRINTQFLLKRNIPKDRDDVWVETISHSKAHRNGYIMTLVNELGIYQCINGSRKMEARKFSDWWLTIIRDLRRAVCLEGYQVFEMMDEKVQNHISEELKNNTKYFKPVYDVFYDDETGELLTTQLLPNGEVEVISYDDNDYPEYLDNYKFL